MGFPPVCRAACPESAMKSKAQCSTPRNLNDSPSHDSPHAARRRKPDGAPEIRIALLHARCRERGSKRGHSALEEKLPAGGIRRRPVVPGNRFHTGREKPINAPASTD